MSQFCACGHRGKMAVFVFSEGRWVFLSTTTMCTHLPLCTNTRLSCCRRHLVLLFVFCGALCLSRVLQLVAAVSTVSAAGAYNFGTDRARYLHGFLGSTGRNTYVALFRQNEQHPPIPPVLSSPNTRQTIRRENKGHVRGCAAKPTAGGLRSVRASGGKPAFPVSVLSYGSLLLLLLLLLAVRCDAVRCGRAREPEPDELFFVLFFLSLSSPEPFRRFQSS